MLLRSWFGARIARAAREQSRRAVAERKAFVERKAAYGFPGPPALPSQAPAAGAPVSAAAQAEPTRLLTEEEQAAWARQLSEHIRVADFKSETLLRFLERTGVALVRTCPVCTK